MVRYHILALNSEVRSFHAEPVIFELYIKCLAISKTDFRDLSAEEQIQRDTLE